MRSEQVALAKYARAAWVLMLACLTSTAHSSIVAKQDPQHADTNEPVRLSARATGDVVKVSLHYARYTLSLDAAGKRSQVLAEPETLARTCETTETVTLLECTHEVAAGFPAASLIQYRAVAHFADGTQSAEAYAFAAGKYPWPEQPIPIRVTGDIRSRLDVVFIPDTDLTLTQFKSQLTSVIYQLYFKYPWYGGTAETNFRNMYNFWYSGEFGNYEETCRFEDPSNMATLTAIGDAIAVLHQTNLRDCRVGKRFSSEIDYDKTIIHESGHALFGLVDEYCCDSSYRQQSQYPNLWASLAACEADAPNLGYPTSFCIQLARGSQTRPFWRVDPPSPAPGCIMGPAQHSDPGSTHLNADIRRMLWTFDKCLSGDCVAGGPGMSTSQRLDELERHVLARMKDLGKQPPAVALVADTATDTDLVLAIQLRIAGDTAKVERTEIIRAPLPKAEATTGLTVRAMSEANGVLHQYAVEDPRLAEVEGKGYVVLPEVKLWVYAPATTAVKSVELVPADTVPFAKAAPMKSLRIDLTPGISKLCEGTSSVDVCFKAERR